MINIHTWCGSGKQDQENKNKCYAALFHNIFLSYTLSLTFCRKYIDWNNFFLVIDKILVVKYTLSVCLVYILIIYSNKTITLNTMMTTIELEWIQFHSNNKKKIYKPNRIRWPYHFHDTIMIACLFVCLFIFLLLNQTKYLFRSLVLHQHYHREWERERERKC